MITHAYVPDEFLKQVFNTNDTGQKLYEHYVAEQINRDTSLWSKVSKKRNTML